MHSNYYVSAKTGDQVNTVFMQAAANLAGIKLTKPELDMMQRQVKAEIVDHKGGKDGDEEEEDVPIEPLKP